MIIFKVKVNDTVTLYSYLIQAKEKIKEGKTMKQYERYQTYNDTQTYWETNPDDQQNIILQALKAGFFSNSNKHSNYVLDFDYMYSQESNNITKHYFMNTSMQWDFDINEDSYYNKLKQVVWTVPGDNRIATEPPKLQAEKNLEKPAAFNFDKSMWADEIVAKHLIKNKRNLGLYGNANE